MFADRIESSLASGRPSTCRAVRLVVVSTYVPRRCGIGSYTGDLVAALAAAAPLWRVEVCALDRDGFSYVSPVGMVIHQDEAREYRRAADEIADRGTNLVLIQHEYGIFGGPEGGHLLALVARLRERGVPYAMTLHTVLGNPNRDQTDVLRELCAGAARVTVFTETARRLLADACIGDPRTVVVVPHGAPEALRTPADPTAVRPLVADVLGEVGDGPVLATFGLIGPGKGLDMAIGALPQVVARHPGVRYLVAGVTHPEEARRRGERYREHLATLARQLGVQRHVRFVNTFLTHAEVAALLARTDLYVTPYRAPEQICSGALTFAVAAGCPVVSTDYRYAVDMLSTSANVDAPGVLVPCGDPAALAHAIRGLLDDRGALARARRAAERIGATLTWPSVAAKLVDALSPAVGERLLRLDHLGRLTRASGILQFARHGAPDPASGYCLDDVARLAIVASGLLTLGGAGEERARCWLGTTLQFIADAAGPAGLRNMRAVDGRWRDEPHLGDHVGRTIWALGVIAAGPAPAGTRRAAATLLRRMMPFTRDLDHLRSVSYAVLGLARARQPDAGTRAALRSSAGRLHAAAATGSPAWRWYEPRLTYDNARLPHALLVAGSALNDTGMFCRALETLDWYLDQVGLAGPEPMLRCIGNLWRERGVDVGHDGDEQPLDAAATVEVLAAAWRATGAARYARLARRAHAWFEGVNRAGVPLHDRATGGCRDGLSLEGANQNMGAESTLAYYQSLLALVDTGLVPAPRVEPALTVASQLLPEPHAAAPAPGPALVGAPTAALTPRGGRP
jgi:glycosyltransferase involved in cell wall biosynthesis